MPTREDFLRTTTVALAGIPFTTLWQCRKETTDGPVTCVTGEDILGPFYRAEAPFRTALNVLNELGTPILIRGTVLSNTDCTTPLPNAIVDVWHADDEGRYDTTSSDYKFRGRMTTDEQGQYEFMSILPARYDNGGQLRPRHIHFRVQTAQHEGLVTQLYFAGDEFIAADPWASRADAGRIIQLVRAGRGIAGSVQYLPSSFMKGTLPFPLTYSFKSLIVLKPNWLACSSRIIRAAVLLKPRGDSKVRLNRCCTSRCT